MGINSSLETGQAGAGPNIADNTYSSRWLVVSGKYRYLEQTRAATEASGAEIITVAIRRIISGKIRRPRICRMWCRRHAIRHCRIPLIIIS